MTANAAVRNLHNDMQRFRKAESNEKTHVAREGKSAAAAKTDLAKETSALKGIASQKQAILDEFSSATPPDAATTQKLLGQMFSLGEQEVQAKDTFTKTIAGDKASAQANAKAAGQDAKAIKADRQKALKDLTPAEYHMNLKDTNRVRKELGLKAVKHAIRPAAPATSKTADLAKKYLGRYESDLQRSGVTLPCPTSESCANFVSSMLSKSGAADFRTLGVDDLNSKLRARGWHQVSLRDAKPGDVWICDGAHGEQHTEIVASNNNGQVTLIGSNNHPNPGDQQINYDSSSANISGSFILAPGK